MDNQKYKTSKGERIQAIIDATSFREPKKIPVGAMFNYWPLAYGGMSLSEAEEDVEKTVSAYMKFFDENHVDFVYGSDFTLSPISVYKILGNTSYDLGDDGLSVTVNPQKAFRMGAEDYDKLIADPLTFAADTFLRHNFPVFMESKETAYEKLKEAARRYKIWMDIERRLSEEFEKRNIPTLKFGNSLPLFYAAPFNDIFTKYRDIKDALLDLRRRKDKVKAACDAIWATNFQPIFDTVKPEDVAVPYPFAQTYFLCESFLNPKQFDELYFDGLMKYCLPYMENGTKFVLRGEGRFIQFMDRFEKLPKGAMSILVDSDDVFEMYEKIGHRHSIWGGITPQMLKFGTVEECKNHVTRCFETMAPGGGFVFMPQSAMNGRDDAKIENIRAVFETANELSLKYGG